MENEDALPITYKRNAAGFLTGSDRNKDKNRILSGSVIGPGISITAKNLISVIYDTGPASTTR